jgi:hypothetical protein
MTLAFPWVTEIATMGYDNDGWRNLFLCIGTSNDVQACPQCALSWSAALPVI